MTDEQKLNAKRATYEKQLVFRFPLMIHYFR